MPANGISRCHSPRTETSARPVSKSSSKEDYTIPRLSKRPSYWPGRGTNNSVNTSGSNVRVGSWLRENAGIEFANGNFVSTSINLKNKSAGDGCRDKTIEKTILRAFRARTFSRSQGSKADLT